MSLSQLLRVASYFCEPYLTHYDTMVTKEEHTASNIRRVHTLDNKELQPYRTLRRPAEHLQQGIFVAEGEKVVRRLLDSPLGVVSMLMTEAWYEKLCADYDFSARNSVVVYLAGKKLLESIVGYNLHQGIMAVGKVPEEKSVESVLSRKEKHLLVALDGLVHSENVGVVVRNCAAFGVDAVIVSKTSSSPYLRRAVRSSMGAVFQIPVIHSEHLPNTLRQLREQFHTRIIAAVPSAETTVESACLTGNVCLVFGSEGYGISLEVFHTTSESVAIPMYNNTDSLNVACASAVLLYEAHRQRHRE